MDDDKQQPWEQRDGEPNRWYQRFNAFRLAGPGRSILTVSNAEKALKGRKESKYTPGSWRNAAEKWQWKARANAWDQHLVDQKAAAIEAKWGGEIMQQTEILGRLSEQGRVNPDIFFTQTTVPRLDIDGQPIKDQDGNVMTYEIVDLDWNAVHEYGHLIKKMKQGRYGWEIELHDPQNALIHMGRHRKLFTDNVDLTSNGKPLQSAKELNDDQLREAVGRLGQVSMAFAGRSALPEAGGDAEGSDPEGQRPEDSDA